jgi:hypothetical protein
MRPSLPLAPILALLVAAGSSSLSAMETKFKIANGSTGVWTLKYKEVNKLKVTLTQGGTAVASRQGGEASTVYYNLDAGKEYLVTVDAPAAAVSADGKAPGRHSTQMSKFEFQLGGSNSLYRVIDATYYMNNYSNDGELVPERVAFSHRNYSGRVGSPHTTVSPATDNVVVLPEKGIEPTIHIRMNAYPTHPANTPGKMF